METDIVDQEGVRGRIVPDAGDGDRITVQVGERRVLVPTGDLKRGHRHGYTLPFRFRDIESVPDSEDMTIPVIEEQLHTETRPHEKRVKLDKHVTTRDEWVDVPTVDEEISIERVAVNREVDAPVDAHYEGDTLVIPLFEEVAVIHKRLVLREEVRVTKRRVESSTPEKVTLRSEEVTVKRDDE